jgi:hypothetical protein
MGTPVIEHAVGELDPDTASSDLPTMTRLSAETCATLDGLDAAAKGRASIVRSCSELRGLSDAERDTLKDLLRCITEQRKRLRALRRLWQSLDVFERPSTGLVEATELCLRENREMASVLEPWRKRTIAQMALSVSATWARLADVADQFTLSDASEQQALPSRGAVPVVS